MLIDWMDSPLTPAEKAVDPLVAGLVSAFIATAVVIILLLFLKLRRRDNRPQFHRLQDLPMVSRTIFYDKSYITLGTCIVRCQHQDYMLLGEERESRTINLMTVVRDYNDVGLVSLLSSIG